MITSLILMTVTLILALSMIPRFYWACHWAAKLEMEQDHESLRELLAEQNAWILRHLGCGLGAIVLVWMAKTLPGMDVPDSLAELMAIYAASTLFFSALESLLAQRIALSLARVPVGVRERDQD